MALQSSGTIKMSEINTELGRTSTATISLDSAESGTYATINTASASTPNNARPASMSEWYSYDHSASAASGYDGSLSRDPAEEGEACQLEAGEQVYKNGTSSTPIATDELYTDSALTTTYSASQEGWHKYIDNSGGGIEYIIYIVNGYQIESVQTC